MKPDYKNTFFLRCIICCAILSLQACVTSNHRYTPSNPVLQLKIKLHTIISDSIFNSTQTSIKVVSLNNGQVLFENNSKVLFHPASNTKLFSSAAFLAELGLDYKFKTSIYIDANPINGILNGNIYLKGFGNPDLTTADLDSISIYLRNNGILQITKNIVVDNSYFDDVYWGPGWTWDDDADPDAAYINALSINKNCIKVTLISDSNLVYQHFVPSTNFITYYNNAKVKTDTIANPIKIKRLALNNPNTIIINGEIPPLSFLEKKLSLRSPEKYAGTLFKECITNAGIIFKGTIVNGIVPTTAKEFYTHLHPIDKVITNLNKVSDNLSAENTLKILGAEKYGVPGTTKKGMFAVRKYLSSIGLDTTKFSLVDGSGVSRYNLLSSDIIVNFLLAMHKQKEIFPVYYNSLPIAGIDGTISDRMQSYPTALNVRAKTGTLNGVSCLSGYVQTKDGEMLAFSIMMQHYIGSAYNYRKAQDKICSVLAAFSRNIIN